MSDDRLFSGGTAANDTSTGGASLAARYREVRAFSEKLCAPLGTEDYVVQTMPDVSPTKWHLAHTSWFFETFLLAPHRPGYRSPNAQYSYLFNSYYNTVGEQYPRPRRGFITRPTVKEVFDYRAYVNDHMVDLLERCDRETLERIRPVIEIGFQHEQQHQELMLTDIKHVLSSNPLRPVYHDRVQQAGGKITPLGWRTYEEGVHSIGHDGDGFAFDNETPRHRVFLEPFEIGDRLVTNGEYIDFIMDGGYERPELWLSEGWNVVQQSGWRAPLYWELRDGKRHIFTLAGIRDVADGEPVCHVSYFEADAYARWADARLLTEAEWEVASRDCDVRGNFADDGWIHPAVPHDGADGKLRQMFGDVWEWTQSSYSAYPGFKTAEGAIGEYNGKFMCNQYVLRGGSCATSKNHIRRTYRNFFPAHARWQFSGIRLARNTKP